MLVYESIFIARPSLSDEEAGKLMEKMKGVVEKAGGSLIKAENWGKRKLAYDVKKERKGSYIILRFNGDGKIIQELERAYRMEETILKFLTVRVVKGDTGVLPTTAPDEGRGPRGRSFHGKEDRR